MNTYEISKYLNSEVFDDIMTIRKAIEFDSTQPQELSVSHLLRYAFLHRLKSALEKYNMSEEQFYKYYKDNYSKEATFLEAEVIYNKFFAHRLKMSFNDYLTKREETWYSCE